jgi:L-lactate dehydrogenase complex protein LldE
MPQRPSAVYYFGTCLADLFFPAAGMAGIKLLQAQGIEVIYPQAQTCCGQPAYSAGRTEEARDVARAQLGLFPKDIPIVVPSGSCGGMIKAHYHALFKGEPDQALADQVAARVIELTQFLVDVLDYRPADLGPPILVTWHGSCHSMRLMGVGTQPKELLRRLANVELVEVQRERECCGFGGVFSVRQPEISAAMVTDKADAIKATGAAAVVSGDCGCLLNIGGAIAKRGDKARSVHIAEFLLERTRARG